MFIETQSGDLIHVDQIQQVDIEREDLDEAGEIFAFAVRAQLTTPLDPDNPYVIIYRSGEESEATSALTNLKTSLTTANLLISPTWPAVTDGQASEDDTELGTDVHLDVL